MKISVAIMLAMLFLADPLLAQRLPRARSRLTGAEAEVTSEATETLKTKVKVKSELKMAAATSPPSNNATSPSPSPEASPPSPSPSPSPPPPSSSPKPPSTTSAKPNAEGSNSTREAPKSSSSTTPEPASSSAPSAPSSSVAPPVSSVQVRMAFSPSPMATGQVNKKLQEERNGKSASIDEEPQNEAASAKPKKTPEVQESTKKPLSTAAASPTPTSTAKPTTSKATSTSKPDHDDEVRDALKRIHQEVLKQPRNQDAKPKSSDSTATSKRPSKDSARPVGDNGGLDTAESAYVRPTSVHLLQDGDTSHLDAQASIQSAKFVLRDQGLQQLPSFVRNKDRLRSGSPNTVRHLLLQKQPLLIQQQQQLQHQQRQPSRSQQLTDPIDEEAITSTTSTTAYPVIPIVHFDKEQSADGSYKTSYETANNIFAEETGFLKNPGVEDQEALVQQGSYSYTAPDGSLISVTYTADEMGFRAAGTHLPTPPPVPPEIQRSLDIIYAQIQRDEEEAAREAEFERQEEASETHEERLDPPTTGSKRESRRYLP